MLGWNVAMPLATASYDVRLVPDPMGPTLDGVAEYDEWREPDEWGEPGRVLRRRLRCVRLRSGDRLEPSCGALTHDGYRFQITNVDPRGRPRWVSM